MLSLLFGPFLTGALVALGSGYFLIPILQKLKARQSISSDAPKSHQSKAGTPTMGGLIILVGALVAALFYPRTSGQPAYLFAAVLCTALFGLIGFVDDLLIVLRGKNLGLRAREKFALQFIVAIAFAVWYYQVDPSRSAPGAAGLSWGRIALAAYHVLLLVWMSNAVNLTDGLDGLAAGVSLPVWLALSVLAVSWSVLSFPPAGGITDYALGGFCAAFAGASLGYLWYNAHPAQVFMGDTGSLAIGGGMAAAAILLHQEWTLLLIALVHHAEGLSVVLQVASFKSTGKRIFKMSPLHHHFELCEVPETRVVARFAIVSAVCAVGALVLIFFLGRAHP
jgi:phospho-N-acetylmuramoyl-pentapeptide-transferase